MSQELVATLWFSQEVSSPENEDNIVEGRAGEGNKVLLTVHDEFRDPVLTEARSLGNAVVPSQYVLLILSYFVCVRN